MPGPCHRLTAASLIVVLALAAAACSRQRPDAAAGEEAAPIPVAAQPAQRGRLRAVVHASGIVVPAQGAEFLAVAPEPARILEISKDAGATVAPGEVVVRFELATATQEAARQRADIARLQAQVENARIAQTRTRDFVARGLVPRTQLETAERELADAESAFARAQTALRAAEEQAARATVTAPFAGVVAQRLHNAGDIAQATTADPVLRIVDPTRLEVLVTVARADVARVAPGATARVAGMIDGQEIPLTVAMPPNLADATANGDVRVRLALSRPAPLVVDMPVEVDIDAEERVDAVFVPAEALLDEGAERVLFVAEGDVARRRLVTTGVANEQGVEITEGLQAGELVIVRGQAGLVDGGAITVVQSPVLPPGQTAP
ncbi:MAG: efflux RND transporter periplasmic adaptor subunit [Vicinamibacterales bacterium]